MDGGTRDRVRCASRWIILATLIATAAPAWARGQVLGRHRADPGEPKPPKEVRTLVPPHPLPGGPWSALGSQLNPGAFVPDEILRGSPHAATPGVLRDAWVLSTWDCSQLLGSEPWDCSRAYQFDPGGRMVPMDLNEFRAAAAARPVVVLVHGNLNAGEIAVNGALYAREWLDRYGALPPDALFVLFDWPSYRVRHFDVLDLAEKQRRAFVAGYHLARILQGLPPGSRVGLIGQSEGGRVVLSALHLLGGGVLESLSPTPPVALPPGSPRGHLRLRAVVIGEAVDHDWIVPGERLGRALCAVEGLLNLYNSRDEALDLYPFTLQSGHRRALGRIGLTEKDRRRIGPLLLKYAESDLEPLIGPIHTLVGVLTFPQVARQLAPYTFALEPTAGPAAANTPPLRPE